jgi:DNA polymerase III sliding clamp (beta) subunit (PCNA family)
MQTVNRKALLSALKIAKPLAPKNAGSCHELALLVFGPNGFSLATHADFGDGRLFQKIDTLNRADQQICVGFSDFLKFIEGMQGETITMEVDTEKREILLNGKLKFVGEDIRNFWVINIVQPLENKESYTYDSTLFANCINYVLPFVSKDTMRPNMCGVYFDGDKMIATDGHRMVWKQAEHTLEHSRILHSHYLKFLAKNAPKAADTITLTFCDKGWVIAKVGSISLYFKVVEERFPDWVSVLTGRLEDTNAATLLIDKKVLEGEIKAALTCSTDSNKVKFSLTKDTCTISSYDEEFSYKYTSEPLEVYYDGEPLEIGVTGTYLLSMLPNCEPQVKINLLSPNKPIIIGDDMLVMPVMLKSYV